MKNLSGITLCVLVLSVFVYTPFSHGYTMADYWAIKEGTSLVFDRELIVIGPQTKTFGTYTGRQFLQGSEFNGNQPFLYAGTDGVLVIGFYDKENGGYLDLSASPIKMAAAQMNPGDTIITTLPKGIFDPNTETVINLTLVGAESVTVPAGTFSDCLKLQVIVQEAAGTFTENIWLAKGVGPVQMYRVGETNGTDGCFLTCGSFNNDTGQIVNRYTKLTGYYQQENQRQAVVVIPLGH